MRPGDTVTGTQGTALVTGMQFRTSLRQGPSTMELTVMVRRNNGREHKREWQIGNGPVNPTLAEIGNAMTALSNTAEAEIIGLLSGNPG